MDDLNVSIKWIDSFISLSLSFSLSGEITRDNRSVFGTVEDSKTELAANDRAIEVWF